jgi:hypothetical protein
MDYVLLIHRSENRPIHEEMAKAYGDFTRDLAASGRMGDSARLQPTRTATTVRVRDGKRVVTDGPFAETREQLGGYYVVNTATPEEAIDIAAKMPGATEGSIEVRPVADFMPAEASSATSAPKKGGLEYILLIHEEEKLWAKLSEAEVGAIMGRYAAFGKATKADGTFVDGAPLVPSAKAKTVRIEGGKRLVTDGPFAETREQLGGYYRVRARDLDEALDLAARIPGAETGCIEVRPVWDMTGQM